MDSMESLYRRRRVTNAIALTLSLAATLFGLFWLAWILLTAFAKGVAAMNLALFTQMTPPPGSDGGLLNAFFGSALMSLLAIAIGAPIGIAAGTYLAEYARTRVVDFVADEYGHIAPEQLGYLTKRLNTEMPLCESPPFGR